ncbi:BLUF domain-containing protein [Mucilaginibacter sp. PPCGB 2223]|uniref:BLUF domain-containing protein n=1 Tax=Mucilaginibacter sp. PPCGB 2223 TaxID=1886027 RepID=UPI0015869779|nr:BLUF domain-containing protein [Mucilaginibacter sp. PPCGB 2223]
MNYLIYVSASSRMLSADDLKKLLEDTRYQYISSGITGMMLYSKGTFFQALEGEEEQLERVFEDLQSDDIQKCVIKLKSGKEDCRTFHDWSMGFKPASEEFSHINGFVDPFRWDFLTDHDQKHPAVNLLKTFAQHNLQY